MQTSDRARAIQPSPTLGISARSSELKAQEIDITDFGAGEPDFNTPEPVKQAGIRAIEENFTGYTQASGTTELKQAVADKLRDDQELEYGLDQITIACGAKHVLFNLMASLLNDGDELIVPAPYWVSYPEQIRFFGGRMKTINTTKTNLLLKPEQLAASITENSRGLLLNSPSNPSGAVYPPELIRELGDICRENGLFIISDEIYEKLVYDEKEAISPASLSPNLKDITVIVNGVSKAYSMTGWRIGYAAGPQELIGRINSLMSHSTSNPCSISQKAATRALKLPNSELLPVVAEFKKRRNLIVERLNALPGVNCRMPGGAFYAFPDFQGVIDQLDGVKSDMQLAKRLLNEAHVAVVPGSAFGTPGYLRLSYATNLETIKIGLDKIAEWVEQTI